MRSQQSFSLLSFLLLFGIGLVPACGSETGGNTTAAGGSTSSSTEQGGGGAGTGASNTTGTGANNTGGTGGIISTGGTGGVVSTGGAGGTAGGGTGGTAGGGTGGFMPVLSPCQNQTYQCGDTIDNDGDGLIDSQDPDCLGPCDNTEDGYYGGIPGQPGPACAVDCYWDSNSGSGNDDCFWNHQCDPNEAMPPGHPEPITKCPYNLNVNISGTSLGCAELYTTQSDTCASVCGPLTPNGCDCFGCCELPAGSGKYVWLGSEDEATGQGSCFADVIDDPTKCEPCQPVAACLNDCGVCELCIGKTTLPPECFPSSTSSSSSSSSSSSTGVGGGSSSSSSSSGTGGGGTMQCPTGIQPCGLPGQSPCPVDYYCITGCCQPIVEPK